MMTPTLVTEIFCLGVGFDPPHSRSRTNNIMCRRYQSKVIFIQILKTDSWLHDTDNHKNSGPDLLLKVLMFSMHQIWSFH